MDKVDIKLGKAENLFHSILNANSETGPDWAKRVCNLYDKILETKDTKLLRRNLLVKSYALSKDGCKDGGNDKKKIKSTMKDVRKTKEKGTSRRKKEEL